MLKPLENFQSWYAAPACWIGCSEVWGSEPQVGFWLVYKGECFGNSALSLLSFGLVVSF